MPLRKHSFRIDEAHRGSRLDQALAELLPGVLGEPISKAKVRQLVVAGAVYLNGKRVRIASKTLLPGARIDAYVDLAKLNRSGPAKDVAFRMTPKHILFEDEFVIVVDKPYGIPTQPTLDEARANLFASVKKFLMERDRNPQAYLGLHHRLDRDTSGVILFTKQTAANAGVAEMFAQHKARKVYNALAAQPPGGSFQLEWTVKNYLRKATGAGKKTRMVAVRSGGDFAETRFRVRERLPAGIWVEAQPLTGRMHQIRVHLAEGGMPILGDATYGGAFARSAPRLMLHAARLTFPHPITQNEVSVESPLPEDFQQCLQALRKPEH